MARKPLRYWTKERCAEEAMKYDTRSTFRVESNGAYNSARKSDCLDEICTHMKQQGNKTARVVYQIFSECGRFAYVGLTYNWVRRHNQHLTDTKSSAHSIVSDGKQYTVKVSDLMPVEDAQALEAKLIEDNRAAGIEVLNKARAGAVGGSSRIWTRDRCVEVASRCRTRMEFKDRFNSAYWSASRRGFLDDACEHMEPLRQPKGTWTLEVCRAEARRFQYRVEFQKLSSAAYDKCLKSGWLDLVCAHMKKAPKGRNARKINWKDRRAAA